LNQKEGNLSGRKTNQTQMKTSSTEQEKIVYYSNGNEVTITDSGLTVKKRLYQLSGISGHSLSIVAPARIPYIVLMGLSVIIFFIGVFNILPTAAALTPMAVMVTGALLFAAGFVVVIMKKEKYAVKIITAEGEKNVVVSQSREYVNQIVAALNRAFLDLTSNQKKK
jgi:hypothetical protein